MKFYIVANFIATRPQTFSQLLDMCGLLDLGRVVSKFSWFNRVDGGCNISKRLDTVYVGKLTQIHSDHCPKLIRCEGDSAMLQIGLSGSRKLKHFIRIFGQ
ncbi:hypothetical protein Lal_00043230 [Lupinus albus]|nr:hypothetical protein Lal_00043230 [Lupinus albus]